MSVDPQHYAAFLERIGHTVRHLGNDWWYDCTRRVYANFPFHRDVDAASLDIRQVLKSDGLIARMCCPEDQGVPSFRMMCYDKNYDFPTLRSRTRTQVRRGLEACTVERIEFSELKRRYLPLQRSTVERQGRCTETVDQAYWDRYIDSASQMTGAETWAAYVNGNMAAYLISFMIEDTANLCIVRSDTQMLKYYPNNALLFRYMYEVMRRPEVVKADYGLESVEPGGENLEQFKTGMGFAREICGQRIVFSPKIAPLLKRPVIRMFQPCVRTFIRSEAGRKIDGLLTWYQNQPVLSNSAPAA
ncbi:MAG: hypothetical protein R3C59_03010 [Planctomycetaceae bacterium]